MGYSRIALQVHIPNHEEKSRGLIDEAHPNKLISHKSNLK